MTEIEEKHSPRAKKKHIFAFQSSLDTYPLHNSPHASIFDNFPLLQDVQTSLQRML